jgi:hypothetical protein
MTSDRTSSAVAIARASGWVSLILFVTMWLELALIPVLGATPTGLLGRIFPIQIFVQFALVILLAFFAGFFSRKAWFILSGVSLLSLILFWLGAVSR